MSRYAFLTDDNQHSFFSKLFFNLPNTPFAVIHYKTSEEDGSEHMKIWYGLGPQPNDKELTFFGDMFRLKSSVKTLYVCTSNFYREDYVQTNNHTHAQGDFAEINLNYYLPTHTLDKPIKNTLHTILIGSQIRDWHKSIKSQTNMIYPFDKLVSNELMSEIERRLPDQLRQKVNTTQMVF